MQCKKGKVLLSNGQRALYVCASRTSENLHLLRSSICPVRVYKRRSPRIEVISESCAGFFSNEKFSHSSGGRPCVYIVYTIDRNGRAHIYAPIRLHSLARCESPRRGAARMHAVRALIENGRKKKWAEPRAQRAKGRERDRREPVRRVNDISSRAAPSALFD